MVFRRPLVAVSALGVGCLALAAYGCGTTNTSFFTDGGGGDDAGNDGVVDDSPFLPPVDSSFPDGGGCVAKCSSDLHTVLDCNDNPVTTCTGLDGCDPQTGTCVNACTAAVK